ncbi:diadenosine tetraphosphate hydrolase [Brevundimonas sp. Leaf280]|nr:MULTISPECIES: HIT family protein [unclassified Brevundimonas]KQP45266.1 diadenosine tetraphosphate hydrolase [Brevundimonas sp. Leaf280]QIF80686.1 HIT domain-containing protein [Brevundimonas sp. 'scallop']
MGFEVAPAFEAGSVAAAEWPLCHVRLQDDARFPWLILIPRVEGALELEDLTVKQRAVLMEETVRAGALVRRLGSVEKLNVGAIGNVTAQLHVHVVGRRRDDGLWPDPVWGRGPVIPYTDDERARRLAIVAGS